MKTFRLTMYALLIMFAACSDGGSDEPNASSCGGQKQKDVLTVTSNKVEMTAEGGTTSIEVKANINYTYEIEESAQSWITKAESRGLTTTTFTLQVAPNESTTKREGKITVKSELFSEVVTIYQEGSTPTLVLTANEYITGRSDDFIKVELKSNVEYEVFMPNVNWIKEFSQAHASSTHTYQYEISENQEGIERKAEIIYKQKDGTLSDTVRIVQSHI